MAERAARPRDAGGLEAVPPERHSVARMPLTKLLVIGLDAAEPALLDLWAREGRLPALAALGERAFRAAIANPPGIYTGAVWPCFFTGAGPARHGRYFYRQLRTGTYDVVDFRADEIHAEPFWEAFTRAGRRSALLDVPKAPLSATLDGLQLCDWATHDAEGPPASHPPTLAADVAGRFGADPVGHCDLVPRDAGALARLRDGLVARAARKADLALDLLGRGGWDLFLTVFAESHCAGHQLWHLHDPAHPRHAPDLARALGEPLRDVYQALDAAVGRLVDAAGPDATVVVFSSHGMGAHHDGTFLLEDVLRRLDGVRDARHAAALEAVRRAWRRAPAVLRRRLQPLADRTYDAARGTDRARRRFFQVPTNDNAAGIRLNLVGREPQGRVRRGAEADAVCAELERELHALVEPATGRPLVRDVLRADDVFRGARRDDLPDLIVRWHRDAPVRGVASPRVGTLAREYPGGRTGDHRAAGLLLACGPGVRPGTADAPVDVTDLAPTFAALLGVPLANVDGHPIAAVAGA
jgi:predicted AlkP superfamily phosphohydrolase/phosphomutase